MASIVKYSGGLRRIEFRYTPNSKTKIIRLGRVSAKVAGTFKDKIVAILADMAANRVNDPEVSKWLGELDEAVLAKLRAVGLASGVGLVHTTLGSLMEKIFASMSCKPATRLSCGHTRRCLEEYFGKDKLVRQITNADADNWRAWMVEHAVPEPTLPLSNLDSAKPAAKIKKLAGATVSRRVIGARTFWNMAIRWKMASENPFEGIKAGHQSNEARKVFVSRAVIEQAMASAPDTEWKAIIALSRYGGLRCPSEHFALKWVDVNWEHGTIRVPCPKLEHLGGAYRIVPLFPELRPVLLELLDEAEDGAEYVIAKSRLGSGNLRQQMYRILAKAGLIPWPRLFHNLRASRESELMKEYDLSTVCKWIGNTPEVAARHYAMSTNINDDFKRAVGKAVDTQEKAQWNAQQTASGGDRQGQTADFSGDAKSPENKAFDASGRAMPSPVRTEKWSLSGSNRRPTPCKGVALAN